MSASLSQSSYKGDREDWQGTSLGSGVIPNAGPKRPSSLAELVTSTRLRQAVATKIVLEAVTASAPSNSGIRAARCLCANECVT
jgi:hypothetical protein